jgi:2-keto-4-pentenoate hydratase
VPVARFMQPRIEGEIGFVLERDLDGDDLTLDDVTRAVAYALPALEIVDSAIVDWNIRLVDTIADNASGAGYAVGAEPRKLDALDLRLCGMVLSRNGDIVSTGAGAACLGHPLAATLWLARKMAAAGRPLRSGELVLSGALGPMVPVRPDDYFTLEIQGFAPLTLAFDR